MGFYTSKRWLGMGFLNHEQYQSCDTSCSLENDLERSADLSQLSNEKKNWLFRVFFRDIFFPVMWEKTQVFGRVFVKMAGKLAEFTTGSASSPHEASWFEIRIHRVTLKPVLAFFWTSSLISLPPTTPKEGLHQISGFKICYTFFIVLFRISLSVGFLQPIVAWTCWLAFRHVSK